MHETLSVEDKTSVVWQTKTKRCEGLRWHKTCPAPVTRSFAQSITKNWGSYVAALLVLKSQCSSCKSLLISKLWLWLLNRGTSVDPKLWASAWLSVEGAMKASRKCLLLWAQRSHKRDEQGVQYLLEYTSSSTFRAQWSHSGYIECPAACSIRWRQFSRSRPSRNSTPNLVR